MQLAGSAGTSAGIRREEVGVSDRLKQPRRIGLVLAKRELESTGDAEIFYKSERQKWSERLRHALAVLTTDEALEDRAAAMAEAMYADDGATAPAAD